MWPSIYRKLRHFLGIGLHSGSEYLKRHHVIMHCSFREAIKHTQFVISLSNANHKDKRPTEQLIQLLVSAGSELC
jgi:hypothetical protein